MTEEENTEGQSEEDMMAAMEAMANDPIPDEAAAPATDSGEGALSQDEIDSLLGFNASEGAATSGIQALLDRSKESYDRLPMLEVVFDRFVRSASTSLRNFTGENIDINIESITSMRFEDYLNSVPLPALLAIFQAVEWENFGIVTIDSSMTYSMVDVLMGGGKTSNPIRIEGRPFTTIEQDMIKSLVKLMLDDMSTAFNPLTPATFRLERLETNPRFASITRPANPAVLISLRVEMDDRGGKVEVLFPYVTIEPVKDLLLQMFSGESFGADVTWEENLYDGIKNTKVTMEAALSPKEITMRDLVELKAGSTIVMNNEPTDELDIICQGVKMMTGRFGSFGKNTAMQVVRINPKGIKKII